MFKVRIILAFLLMVSITSLTACGGGGGTGGGTGGGGGVSLTVNINPDDGIALTQSATLSWSSDGTSATLITKEVATIQAQTEVKQDDRPRVIYKKESDGRVRITHILYEDDIKKKAEQKAAAIEEKTIATTTIAPSGSMHVSPTKTTTYTIRATGPNGSVEKSVTLTVIPQTPDELVITYNSHGFKGQKPIRWDDSIVNVYDATGYSRLQEALDAWNQAIGGPVTFKKSTNPNAPLKIRYDAAYIEQFGNSSICAVAPLEPPDNNFRIVGANIILHPNRCVGSHALMVHEIGHAVGFFVHTNNGSVMDASVYTDKIDALVRITINRLYQLPIGMSF